MKTLALFIALFALFPGSMRAAEKETLQERLLRVEMDYAEALGMGYTSEHPKIQGLKAELAVLNKTPGIRNDKYRELAAQKKILLEADLSRLRAEGYPLAHPKVQSVKRQLDFMAASLSEKASSVSVENNGKFELKETRLQNKQEVTLSGYADFGFEVKK